MHPVNNSNSAYKPTTVQPYFSISTFFGKIWDSLFTSAPEALPPLASTREVVPLSAVPSGEGISSELDDKKEMNFKPVVSVAVEPLRILLKPTFEPYTLKLENRDFVVGLLAQEEAMIKELIEIVETSQKPVKIKEGLPEKRFAEIMKRSSPHLKRVRDLFEKNFEISRDPWSACEAIGPKIAKEEDMGDGTTQITYRNGKVKTVLQRYSKARHPWAKEMLEKGLELPPNTAECLQAVMPKIIGNHQDEDPVGLTRYKGVSTVFSLDAIPGVIFKRAGAERFENMIKAQFICHALCLDLLVVPSARMIEIEYLGKTYLFIAEEKLNVDTDHSVQEERYRKYTCGMDELVKQLILFILNMNLSDISWRNIPLFNDNVAKVGLVDLGETSFCPSSGLLGTEDDPERGLLSCLFSEEQIDMVVEAARPYGANEAEAMRQRRLQELEQEEQLQQFYVEKGLLKDPRRLIQLSEEDLANLDLNLDEVFETFEFEMRSMKPHFLRQAVQDVVDEINDTIQEADPKATIKGARRALLNLDDCNNAEGYADHAGTERGSRLRRISGYGTRFGLPKESRGKCRYGGLSSEEMDQLWLNRIARALVLAGHIGYFKTKNADYIFQA